MNEPKFTLNLQSDGRESLTIRSDDEAELEALRAKWAFLVFDGQPKTPASKPGCPKCGSETVLRKGTSKKGVPYEFVGCTSFPKCDYSAQNGK